MRASRLASLFVLGAAVVACAESKPPADHSNDAVTGRPANTFSFPPVEKIASPTDPASNLAIMVGASGACYVDTTPSKKTPLPCPPGIAVTEWSHACADRLVVFRGDVCQCEVFGDPPYIGRVPCPTTKP